MTRWCSTTSCLARSQIACCVHAYKMVNGQNQPMGDLDFASDAGLKAWAADFSNARVRIRFIFDVHGASLEGRLIDLKAGRVARHIRVSREASAR